MKKRSKKTDSDHSNKNMWLLFLGGIIAAILGFLGQKYSADTNLEIALKAFSATQTIEAKSSLIALKSAETSTAAVTTPTPSQVPEPVLRSSATSTLTNTPTIARLSAPSMTPTVKWTIDITGIPKSGKEIAWQLDTGYVLMFGGGQFEMNGASCKADAQSEICILLYKATKTQMVLIRNVLEQGNRVGITATLNPVDALNENERLLWQYPNCGNGCIRALVKYFTDGQLTGEEIRTRPPGTASVIPQTREEAVALFGGPAASSWQICQNEPTPSLKSSCWTFSLPNNGYRVSVPKNCLEGDTIQGWRYREARPPGKPDSIQGTKSIWDALEAASIRCS